MTKTFNINVIECNNVRKEFNVMLAHRFRVLKSIPKCWERVQCYIRTEHGRYESGDTTIYQSKNTKKYYMVRYFDGCFKQMYAEVQEVDFKKVLMDLYKAEKAKGNC